MSDDLKRLLKNLLVILIIVSIGLLVYTVFFNKSDNPDLEIEETPIQIESIRTIAEISTVSYSDEVVVDTIEYQKGSNNWFSADDWVKWYNNDVNRRLTIIVKGEVKYGLNLTKKNYRIESGKDTVKLFLPKAKMLDVIVTPSKTEIFHETGKWNDNVRRKMELQATQELKENAEKLNLKVRAEENAERMFKKLIQTNKKLIIEFNEEK